MVYVRSGEDAFHHPYLRQLPRVCDGPLWWSEVELGELEGTNLGHSVRLLRQEGLKDYKRRVLPLTEADPRNFPKEIFSFAAILWARSMCSSRSFPTWCARSLSPSVTPYLKPVEPRGRTCSLEHEAQTSQGLVIVEDNVDSTTAPSAASPLGKGGLPTDSKVSTFPWVPDDSDGGVVLCPFLDMLNHRAGAPIFLASCGTEQQQSRA